MPRATQVFRVSVAWGLTDLVLIRMEDGTEWCVSELRGGVRPVKAGRFHCKLKTRPDRVVSKTWSTKVPLEAVAHLLTDAEKAQFNHTTERKGRETVFLVSMQALSELLWRTPKTRGWAAGRTFATIEDLMRATAPCFLCRHIDSFVRLLGDGATVEAIDALVALSAAPTWWERRRPGILRAAPRVPPLPVSVSVSVSMPAAAPTSGSGSGSGSGSRSRSRSSSPSVARDRKRHHVEAAT
jgi:hypothetical protein